jgi:hypothetical protein
MVWLNGFKQSEPVAIRIVEMASIAYLHTAGPIEKAPVMCEIPGIFCLHFSCVKTIYAFVK